MEKKVTNEFITEYNKPFIMQRADPYIYQHIDKTYYFTASVPSYNKIILRHADKLSSLKDAEEVTVWKKHKSGPMSEHIWAPELHYLWGKWYLYFAAGEKENKWKIRPYVLECKGQNPLTDEWQELGKMQGAKEDEFSFEAFSLDATILENQGQYYYIWAEKVGVGKGISNLYIARMEAPNKLATVQVLLTSPDYDWERIGFWVDEGPAVLKRNNKIYLTFSSSATSSCYCVGMLSTEKEKDLLDPQSWKKERYPVICTDEEKGIYGPGHNSFTKDDKGNDICVFHARTYKEISGDPLYDPNRHTMLMKISWDKQDKPVFAFTKVSEWE